MLKKASEHQYDSITTHRKRPQKNPEETRKEPEETENPGKNWNHPDHSTTEISYNTFGPEELKRFTVSQTSMKNHLLELF